MDLHKLTTLSQADRWPVTIINAVRSFIFPLDTSPLYHTTLGQHLPLGRQLLKYDQHTTILIEADRWIVSFQLLLST